MRVKFPNHDYHLYKSFRICAKAVLTSGIVSCSYYFLQHLPLKAKYADFYATYDPMDSFKRMRDGGYLQSCPKEG